eukprot:5292540-Alexandrium_andersonii.AAC.1
MPPALGLLERQHPGSCVEERVDLPHQGQDVLQRDVHRDALENLGVEQKVRVAELVHRGPLLGRGLQASTGGSGND